MTELLDGDRFTEQMKKLVDNPETCVCSKCGSSNLLCMHGMAGGGIGVYILCVNCGAIPWKCLDEGAAGACFQHYIEAELEKQ